MLWHYYFLISETCNNARVQSEVSLHFGPSYALIRHVILEVITSSDLKTTELNEKAKANYYWERSNKWRTNMKSIARPKPIFARSVSEQSLFFPQITRSNQTLDYVSCFPLHFLRALAASCVLNYRMEHSGGFLFVKLITSNNQRVGYFGTIRNTLNARWPTA